MDAQLLMPIWPTVLSPKQSKPLRTDRWTLAQSTTDISGTVCARLQNLVCLGLTYASAMSGTPVSGLGGLTERLVVIEILAWYVASGWRMLVELAAEDPGA